MLMYGRANKMHHNIMTFSRSLCSFLSLVPFILPNVISIRSENRRYAAYDYDLTTPQYTPDGRLLQVEYATNACIRDDSNPIVGVGVSISSEKDDTVLIMATVCSTPLLSPVSQTLHMNRHEKGSRLDNKRLQRAQFRIIEVPLAGQNDFTSTILIGLSGLLSDATSLLQVAYSQLEEEQRMFGWHRLGLSPVGRAALSLEPSLRKSQPIVAQPSETALRLSRAVADECQKHAFGGGLRPFGASLLFAGVDDVCRNLGARVAISETHPNGGCQSNVFSVTSNGCESKNVNMFAIANSPQIMVSGKRRVLFLDLDEVQILVVEDLSSRQIVHCFQRRPCEISVQIEALH